MNFTQVQGKKTRSNRGSLAFKKIQKKNSTYFFFTLYFCVKVLKNLHSARMFLITGEGVMVNLTSFSLSHLFQHHYSSLQSHDPSEIITIC